MDDFKNHTLGGGFPMTKRMSVMTGTTAIMLLLGVPSWAAEQPGLGIANNDSVYIDGNSLKIVPGKGKGDASALINKLDAHAVGAGMIIFRSGDKLYMAEAPSPVIQTSSGADRYGSDRDTSVSAAQAERDWQDYLRSQNRRYGSDRDTSVSAAQAERDWRDWQEFTRQNPRYGSRGADANASARYGSDRDTSVSAAQAERDWQDYLRSQNRRYGSDRATSVSAAQAERDWSDWQEVTRQNPRYGSRGADANASARYGSDRDTSVSAAQAERDWQDYLRSQNRRYGSDRDTSVSAAQSERDWQDYLRSQNRRYGSDRDTSVSAAQAERDWRDWQEFTRQNPRYGSRGADANASARYGSDRDTSVSAAQAERDWQDYLR